MNQGSLDDVLRVAAFAKRYPDLASESSLRWQIFHSDSNGLDDAGAILRVGGRVFIHRGRYLNWLFIEGSSNGVDSESVADDESQ
jgi:hypothetical protein